ncbi:hypothetical protein [Nocardia testacea]|uniref:hypothetical protein n=1 Tax=Nocardia testacea TaxID=248551 RepID=UPI0002FC748D|nr:hypothetical protein [Nocardia testacea]
MTVLFDTFTDVSDGPVSGVVEIWRPDLGPDADGPGSTTTNRVTVPVVDGDLTTPDLDPGPAKVMLRFGTWAAPKTIAIPDSAEPVRLTSLFTQFEPQPPAVVSQAWQAANAAGAARVAAEAARDDATDAADAASQSAAAAAQSAEDAAAVVSDGVPNASATVKGGLRLTGDLGGTWDSPTVPGLAGKAAASHQHATGDVTGLQAELDGKADVVHEHTLTDIAALPAALDGKQSTAAKGQAGGYAPLDASGLLPAVHLPSYVDDVLEYASTSAFPASGVAGKIYVALDTNRVYRWGGSSYTEISPSPGSTDAVPEGAANKYFTEARAQAALAGPLAGKADASSVVHLSGAETITGPKTFDASPTVPAPSAAGHAARKADVDAKVGSDGTVVTLVRITQAQYDALGSGRPAGTWFGIVG